MLGIAGMYKKCINEYECINMQRWLKALGILGLWVGDRVSDVVECECINVV